MAKGLLDLIFDEKWKGKQGERLTELELRIGNFFGWKGKPLRNIYIPKDNGETTEIDLVYITKKGILVFESKNYSGWIFGDEKSQYWTAMLPNREKNRFYNPIKQNRTHIRWLRRYIGDDIPLFSIIVFSERCELKKVTIESSDVKVIKRDDTPIAVRQIWNEQEDIISEADVEKLYEVLRKLTNVDKAVKASHIAAIQNRHSNAKQSVTKRPMQAPANLSEGAPTAVTTSDSDRAETNNSEARTCPRCGKELVLRTAKRGKSAGNQFYGCSGFPSCRYTEDANKELK